MTSVYPYETVSTPRQGLSEGLLPRHHHHTPNVCPQSANNLFTFGIRSAGVLKYGRESDDLWMKMTPVFPAPVVQSTLRCEYCGEDAKPSLDLTWTQGSEAIPSFCCEHRKKLWEMLTALSSYLRTTSEKDHQPSASDEESLIQDNDIVDCRSFMKTCKRRIRAKKKQIEVKLQEECTIYQPEEEIFPPSSDVFRFQFCSSSHHRCFRASSYGVSEAHLKKEEEVVVLPICNHKTDQFGICHHPDKEIIIEKYYSNGLKFLTLFPDGSAQVFYPSGHLAVTVVVTGQNGRVCIVYDDGDAPQPMRAMFHSDGRATCYHSSGGTWLTLNRSGGQCLDKEGISVRRWSWGSPSPRPAPLKPIFLSLNKAVGVRVLGKAQVFVSFLAGGQQARFSVGSCCAQTDCETNKASPGPSLLKEELFVLAARLKLHLPITNLHHDLITLPQSGLQKTTQVSQCHVVASKLLEGSAKVEMSMSELEFIHRCLKEYFAVESTVMQPDHSLCVHHT